MTKSKKKKRENALLLSLNQNLQQLIHSGDTITINGHVVDTSSVADAAPKPEDVKWQSLLRHHEELKKQERVIQGERIAMESEREAIAVLATHNQADPEITRISILLRLRCEGIEVRDRVLARERSELTAEFDIAQRYRKKSAAVQNHKQKTSKPHAAIAFNVGMPRRYEEDIMAPEHDTKQEKSAEIKQEPFSHAEYPSTTPGPPYDDTANTPAMNVDTGTKVGLHQGVHPQRLHQLEVNYSEPFSVESSTAQCPSETMHFSRAFATSSNRVSQHRPPVSTTKKMSLSDYLAAKGKNNETANNSAAECHDAEISISNLRSQGNEHMSPDLSIQAPETYETFSNTSGAQQLGFNFSSNLVTPQPTTGCNNVPYSVPSSSLDTCEQQPGFNFTSNLIKPQPTVEGNNIRKLDLESSPNTGKQQQEFNFSSSLVTPQPAVGCLNVDSQSPVSLAGISGESTLDPSSNLILPLPECEKSPGQLPDLIFHTPQVKIEQDATIWGRRW